jgi:hypothetical protein
VALDEGRPGLPLVWLSHGVERRADGTRDLQELDLIEVSIVPHPANPQTRFLNLKAVAGRGVPTDAELRQQAKTLGLEPPLTRRQLRRRSDEMAPGTCVGLAAPAHGDPRTGQVRTDSGAAAPAMRTASGSSC